MGVHPGEGTVAFTHPISPALGRLQCLTQSRWSEVVVNRKLGQRPYIILFKQLSLPDAVGEKWQPNDRETDAHLSKGTGQSLSQRASESPWGEALLSCSLILFPYIWVALPLLTYTHPSSNIRLLIQTWNLVSLKPSTFRLAGLEATGGAWKYFSAHWPRDPRKPQINTHLRASTYFGFYLLLPPSQWRKGMSITGHFSFCQNKVRAQPTRWLTSRGAEHHTSDITGPCHADVSHFSWKQLWDSVLLSTFIVQDICPRQLALKQIGVSLLIPPLTQGCSGVNRLQISSYPKPQKLREFGDVTTDWDDSGLGCIPNPMRVSFCETEQGIYRHGGNHRKMAAETAPLLPQATESQELPGAGGGRP